jgi:hypothetical protein
MYGNQDDSWNPHSSRDAEVEALTGIQKLRSTTACSGGDSLLLRSPLGDHAGVREVEGSVQEGRCTKEEEVAAREERHVAIDVFSPPKGPSLNRG